MVGEWEIEMIFNVTREERVLPDEKWYAVVFVSG